MFVTDWVPRQCEKIWSVVQAALLGLVDEVVLNELAPALVYLVYRFPSTSRQPRLRQLHMAVVPPIVLSGDINE